MPRAPSGERCCESGVCQGDETTQPWEPIAGLVAGLALALGGFPIVLMGSDDGDGGTSLKLMAWATAPILLLSVLYSWWPVRRSASKVAGVAPPGGSA